MPRPKKNKDLEIIAKKIPAVVREEIRNAIRLDSSTLLKKQMVLKEAVRSEDNRRLEFIKQRLKMETKSLPINILKLIGSLKKAVRQTMRYKGGTPFSIIRELFIYWDADKSGEMSAKELLSCMNSLGVIITIKECKEVVAYYNGGVLDGEMLYKELLKDIQYGEPSLIEYVTEEQEKESASQELHFEQFEESFKEKPPTVIKFIEATREWVQKLLRDVGGTPDEHVRFLFKFYDFDYSNGLYAEELMIAAKRSMKLTVTQKNAEEIVKFYDRKHNGQIHYDAFVTDICSHVKPILAFSELTPRSIAEAKRSLAKNHFIPRPFQAPHNKILEKFKKDCQMALLAKVNKLGGSISSWVRDAFIFWDPGYTRKISTVDALLGASKRIGITLTEEDGRVLMSCYDKEKTGEMHYDYLIEDLVKESPNFLMSGTLVTNPDLTPTHRTPPMVIKALQKLKRACDNLVRQAKGAIQSRDILHGTFVRFDASQTGHIEASAFKAVIAEIRATISDTDIMATLTWFDSTGSNVLDYNNLVRQVYGEDISTSKLALPRISETKAFNKLSQALNATTFGSSIVDPPFRYSIPKGNGFGVTEATKSKNLNVIESQSVKLARLKLKKQQILSEKMKIETRVNVIDSQKKQVIDAFRASKAATLAKLTLES